MFAKVNVINKDGATTATLWLHKEHMKSLQRISANADFVDHTRVTMAYTADGQELAFLVDETPEDILPSGDAVLRS